MTNEIKLLRAFIEASGFDVEEERIPLNDFAVSNWNNSGRIGDRPTATIDYKVTKKPDPLNVLYDGVTLKQLTQNVINIHCDFNLSASDKWIKYSEVQFKAVVEWFGDGAKRINEHRYNILSVEVSLDEKD